MTAQLEYFCDLLTVLLEYIDPYYARRLCTLPTAHTNAAMNSYFFRLPIDWNSLPIIDHTQSCTNCNKTEIEEIFMESFPS